jgi:Domain of unknown function (DUF4129)
VSDGASAEIGGPDVAPPGTATGRDIRRARLLLTGLLIAAVIFGIRAVPALGWQRDWRGPWHDQGTAIVIGLEVVLGCLLTWLLLRGRRRPDASWLAIRLRAWLSVLIPAVMILGAVALLRYIRLPQDGRHPLPKTPPGRPPPSFRVQGGQHQLVSPGTATVIEYTVLAIIIALIAVAAVVLLRRLRRADRRERLVVAPDEAALVREAVVAGRTALAGVSDARMAIIACYLAMERSLGDAGTARRPAETADELLARATGDGLLRGEPPGRLTALFYEARFSRHEVPATARTAALEALDVILADLGGRASQARQAGDPAVAS